MRIRQFLTMVGFLGLLALAHAQTDPASKPQRLRVSSGVAQGLKTHDVTPRYPAEARERGIQGDVLLQATIDEKGNIILRSVQGDPILAKAAIDAVKQWKYRPYVLNGKTVQVDTVIKIEFHR